MMLLYHYGATSTRCSMKCPTDRQTQLLRRKAPILLHLTAGNSVAAAVAAAAAAIVLSAGAIEVAAPSQPEETLSNIPQTLSSVCSPDEKDCRKRYKIQRPKSKKAETCTSKCASTCIQGGFGSPGEGPFNIRRCLMEGACGQCPLNFPCHGYADYDDEMKHEMLHVTTSGFQR